MLHQATHQDHAIRELQAKTVSVADGAAANANIAVAGIGTADTVGSVVMFAAGVPSVVPVSEVTITAAGIIQLSTTVSTGNKLVVEWYPHVGS